MARKHRRTRERAALRAESVPEVLEPLGVTSLGLATTDADHLETLRAGLEGANDRRSHAQDVPDRELDDLVVELGTTRPGDHDVDLLLHAMPVTPRHPGTRVVREAAHAELGRSQRLARESPLHRRVVRADIAKLVEVLLRPLGHPGTLALAANRAA